MLSHCQTQLNIALLNTSAVNCVQKSSLLIITGLSGVCNHRSDLQNWWTIHEAGVRRFIKSQGAFSLGLRRRSSAWVLIFCGVTACDRRDVGVLKRGMKAIFRLTGVTSLTWRNHEWLLDLWRLLVPRTM